MALVLSKSKQAKTRVDLKRKRVGSENEIVSQAGFEPLKLGLYFNVYLVSKIIKVHDFMPDPKVGQFMCTEANLRTNLSSLMISLKSPLITLAYF